MINKITAIAFQLMIIVLFVGCIKSYPSQSSLYHLRPSDHYALFLKKETNRIMFNICSGFVFVIKTYEIELPSKPDGHVIYTFRQIKIRQTSHKEGKIDDFTSGEVIVDINKSRVSISLKTPEGDFAGNGEYLIDRVE